MGAGAGIEIVMTLSLIASVDVSHGTYVCVCMQGIFIMSHTSHACQKIACAMRRLALNHQTHDQFNTHNPCVSATTHCCAIPHHAHRETHTHTCAHVHTHVHTYTHVALRVCIQQRVSILMACTMTAHSLQLQLTCCMYMCLHF